MSEPWYTEIPKGALLVLPDQAAPYQLEPDDSPIREQFRAGFEQISPEARPTTTLMEALRAGWQQSVWGLSGLPLGRERLPDLFLPEEAGWADWTGSQVGALAGDWPFMLVGASLGAASGGGLFSAITAGGGALALPAGIRKVLVDKYENGEVDSFARFWQMLSGAVIEEFKMWVVGATTAGAGKVAGASPVLPRTAALSTEIGTLATMGAALEGRTPEPRDFGQAAIIVGGMRGVGFTRKKLGQVYARTGRRPYEIVEDIEADPTIKEDLNSVNIEIPRSYKPLEERLPGEEAARPERPAPEPSEPQPEITGDEAYQHVRSRISIGEKQQKRPYTFHDFYTQWIESVHPLGVITKAMERSIKEKDPSFTLKITEDPYRLARLRPGVTALGTHFIDWAPMRFVDRMPLGRPLRQILGPLRNNLETWDTYAVAKRAPELEARGIETGIDRVFAERVVRDVGNRIADKKTGTSYEHARQEVRQFQRYTLEYLRDSGVISDKTFSVIDQLNEYYVPYERCFQEAKAKPKPERRKAARDPVRRIFGSEEKVISPSETIIKNTYLLVQAAENNRVAQKLAELAETSPEGRRFARKKKMRVRKITISDQEKETMLRRFRSERGRLDQEVLETVADFLDEEMSVFRPSYMRPKPDEISVFREGKRELWKVDPEVAEALHGSTAGEIDALRKFFTVPARMLRAGAILTPEFMARNPIRDQFMAFVNSESGYRLMWDWFSGVKAMVKEEDWMSAYRRSGAPMAEIVALDRTYNQTTVKDLARSLWWRNIRNSIRNPVEGLRLLATVSEMGTRVGAFKRGIRHRGFRNPIEADIDSILEAGLEAREISLDFGRIGSRAVAWNRVIPFFNASMQGVDKIARNFKDRPAATTAKIALGITIPSILLYLHNRSQPGWDEIPKWEKDLFWLFPVTGERLSWLPSMMKVRIGDRVWLRGPKPFEVGIIFGSGAERIAESILKKNPRAFDDFAETVWRGTSPGFVPTAVAPIIETFANRSLWIDRPQIPARREGMLPEFQYQPYTTSLTKTIGRYIARLPMIGDTKAASPIVIDTFVRDWTGGLGMHVVNLADAALRKAGVIPDPPRPMDTLADLPLFKAFVVRYPSMSAESISTFYERYGKHQKMIETADVLKREGEFSEYIDFQTAHAGYTVDLSDIARTMGECARVVRMIDANPDPALTPEERSQIQENMIHMMVQLAKTGNMIFDRFEEATKER